MEKLNCPSTQNSVSNDKETIRHFRSKTFNRSDRVEGLETGGRLAVDPSSIAFSSCMSALGQRQTCAAQKVMSALSLKADMCGALADVRFVPEATFFRCRCQIERPPCGVFSNPNLAQIMTSCLSSRSLIATWPLPPSGRAGHVIPASSDCCCPGA